MCHFPWLHLCEPSLYCGDVKEPPGTTVVDHPLRSNFLIVKCLRMLSNSFGTILNYYFIFFFLIFILHDKYADINNNNNNVVLIKHPLYKVLYNKIQAVGCKYLLNIKSNPKQMCLKTKWDCPQIFCTDHGLSTNCLWSYFHVSLPEGLG